MIIPTDNDFLMKYQLDHPVFKEVPTFKYYELPLMGLGPDGLPFIEIDRYINTNGFEEIYQEIKNNKDKLVPFTKGLVVNGIVPKDHNNNYKSIDSILLNPDKYLTFPYAEDIKELDTLSKVKSYFYNKFGIPEAWQGICHMREYTNYANKSNQSKWLPHSEHFPLMTKFIESLPFKSLGYAIFFISNGDNTKPAFLHRDLFHRSHHKSNFINIMFDRKPRPFFVYDALKRKKVYVNRNCCMYTFNESDIHGVDIEPEPRYMIRIEGIFEDWFAEKIGFVKSPSGDYYESFDWNYDKPKAYLESIGGKLNIWQETDI